MFDLTGLGRRVCFGLKTPQCAAIVIAVMTAGCSADVTRFDSASFNLNDPPEETAAAPVPTEPVRSHSDYSSSVATSTPRGPYGAGAGSVEVAALPEPQSPPPVVRPYTDESWKRTPTAPSYAQPAAASPVTTAAASPAQNEIITVQPGDTLYGLSRRHHVSLNELMTANGMTSPARRPGQKLIMPASGSQPRSAPRAAEVAAAAAPEPVLSPEITAKYGSTYTVQPGDSIYKIARSNGANYAELQRVNGITDPRKVMPGRVLKIPGAASVSSPVATAPTLPPAAVAEAAPAVSAPRMAQSATTQPTVINAGQQVAALNGTATDASPAPQASAEPAPKADKIANAEPQAQAQAGDSTKLRWPVNGRVIAGFGGRPDGTHNDGINLSVPLGTDVHAAEAGIVAYAGSELKGYGNLILLRHDNGWVTAYAHNDEMLVKRGDKIKRGQVIGKAGKTGTVDQPQVHFELRQGSKPVDPTPFMEKI
ncbi:MAG: peptidoglycan DD-metalloendopeptidase family protein [Hyphomicrobium sp.]|nr:peptidoglycan DD-metalloendopeptidase family protein [Hyphomicrobium sp.]